MRSILGKRARPQAYIGLDSSNRFCPVLDEKQQQPIDPVLDEPIPRNRLLRLDVNGQLQCYDVLTLKRIVDTQHTPVEPFSNIPFSSELISLIRSHPAEYTIEHKESIQQGNLFRRQEVERESERVRQQYQQQHQPSYPPYYYNSTTSQNSYLDALDREARAELLTSRRGVQNAVRVLIRDGIVGLPEFPGGNFTQLTETPVQMSILARKIDPTLPEVTNVLITSPYLLSVLPHETAGQLVNLVYDAAENTVDVYSSATPFHKIASLSPEIIDSVDPLYLHTVHFAIFRMRLSDYSELLARLFPAR